MRILKNKLEYVIECECSISIAYDIDDIAKYNGREIGCPGCQRRYPLNASHTIFTLEMTDIHQEMIKLIETS